MKYTRVLLEITRVSLQSKPKNSRSLLFKFWCKTISHGRTVTLHRNTAVSQQRQPGQSNWAAFRKIQLTLYKTIKSYTIWKIPPSSEGKDKTRGTFQNYRMSHYLSDGENLQITILCPSQDIRLEKWKRTQKCITLFGQLCIYLFMQKTDFDLKNAH